MLGTQDVWMHESVTVLILWRSALQTAQALYPESLVHQVNTSMCWSGADELESSIYLQEPSITHLIIEDVFREAV